MSLFAYFLMNFFIGFGTFSAVLLGNPDLSPASKSFETNKFNFAAILFVFAFFLYIIVSI